MTAAENNFGRAPLERGDRSAGKRRIYVASSWRNVNQPTTVQMLRGAGHEVYDFRNPAEGNSGFAWSEIDPDWIGWSPRAFRDLLDDPIAVAGFGLDFDAMEWAALCPAVTSPLTEPEDVRDATSRIQTEAPSGPLSGGVVSGEGAGRSNPTTGDEQSSSCGGEQT